MNEATATFVERIAAAGDTEGLSRIAGRIFGLLLVTAEPLSLDQLAEQLGASKASVSQDARMLAQRGVIERICKHGDRKDYYQVPEDLFVRIMEGRLARWKKFHDAVHSGRVELKIRSAEVQRRLDEFEGAYSQVAGAVAAAIQAWRNGRHGKGKRSA